VTIYVDSVFIAWRGKKWCHLMSDDYDSTELHAFAQALGLRREWFQWRSKMTKDGIAPPWQWHYDVTEGKREKAIAAGARTMDRFELARIMDHKRKIFGQLSEEDKAAERARWEAIALGREKWEQAGLF
jgi:hypothetical protein